jgi:hypothetical protein
MVMLEEIIRLAEGRRQALCGEVEDMDDVIADIEKIVHGACLTGSNNYARGSCRFEDPDGSSSCAARRCTICASA